MFYKRYDPPPSLASCIECMVIFEDDGLLRNQVLNIVPNGLPELAIHYGDKHSSYINRESEVGRGYLYGPHCNPGYFKSNGAVKCLCVLFRPYGAYGVLGIRQNELANAAIDLELLCGAQGKNLIERVGNAVTPEERIKEVVAFFERLLSRRAILADPFLASALSRIHITGGRVKIGQLCAECAVSERKMQRAFHSFVGLSAKAYSAIVRINQAYRRLDAQKEPNLSQIALQCGYYDQAHFIKDCKRFTKHTPQTLARHDRQSVIYLNRMYTFLTIPDHPSGD